MFNNQNMCSEYLMEREKNLKDFINVKKGGLKQGGVLLALGRL